MKGGNKERRAFGGRSRGNIAPFPWGGVINDGPGLGRSIVKILHLPGTKLTCPLSRTKGQMDARIYVKGDGGA